MKPVKVKTVQVKAGQLKLASAGRPNPSAGHQRHTAARPEVPETSSAVVAKAETNKAEANRAKPRPETQSKLPEWKCRRSPQTMAPETACSAFCPHPACRPRPARRRWPTPIRLPAPSRRPHSKTAPSGPRPLTPAGSFRSARWKARAKRGSASRRRAIRPAACLRRPILYRTGCRKGRQEAVPGSLRRP